MARVEAVSRTDADPRQGPLQRAAGVVYWVLVVEVLLVLVTLPGLLAALLLDPSPGNLPLFALAALPAGPALAAALFAWRVFLRERDTSPARHFWRGYRVNALDALKVWVPALAVLTVLLTNITFRAGPVGLFVGLGVVVLLLALRLTSITSTFSFRFRDALRIAAWSLTAAPLATLGLLSLLVLTAGITVVTSDAVAVLLASVLTLLVARNEAPLVERVRERFVEPVPDGA